MALFVKARFLIDNPSWAIGIYIAKIKALLYYRYKFNSFGLNSILLKPLFITYKYITVGNHAFIWPSCRIEGISVYQGQNYAPRIVIEDYVSIQQNLHLTCANSIVIGANTAIAANVSITDIDHPYNDISKAPENQKLRVGSVVIGSDCKIYNNAIILPGVTLGKHTIIGANSIVTSGIYPDYCVIVGAPARIVKRYNDKCNSWQKTDTSGNFI